MVNSIVGGVYIWNANREAGSGRRPWTLGFALLVALVLVMAMAAGTWAFGDSDELAANPELSAARRYAHSTRDNLEFAVRESYAIAAGGTSPSAATAANPELAAVGRYARGTSQGVALDARLDSVAGLYEVYARGTSRSAALAANPELMAAGRFAGLSGVAASQGNNFSFLAANPEVMTARRYSGGALSECGVALGC